MEENVPGIAKKIWEIVRVAFFMIRKGICKKKILLDLNMMMKRRKLAGKSFRNLIFHHHHHHHSAASEDIQYSATTATLHKNKRRPHHFDDAEAVNKVVLEIMTTTTSNTDVAASPGFRFGRSRSPMVRQLRVTDSPFPLQDNPDENSRRVDQAAEDFINKFYSQLKQQQ